MSGSDLPAQITAAKAYEEFLVPALFGEWAPRVAAAARTRTGDHVLDVACGTGVLAREAASQVANALLRGGACCRRRCRVGFDLVDRAILQDGRRVRKTGRDIELFRAQPQTLQQDLENAFGRGAG
jgi:ubiquinone/menaquinone biosynthesis C-methylase UbiE